MNARAGADSIFTEDRFPLSISGEDAELRNLQMVGGFKRPLRDESQPFRADSGKWDTLRNRIRADIGKLPFADALPCAVPFSGKGEVRRGSCRRIRLRRKHESMNFRLLRQIEEEFEPGNGRRFDTVIIGSVQRAALRIAVYFRCEK